MPVVRSVDRFRTVRARAIGIEEVFVNLLCNAIESRSEDTRVRVAARSEPQHVSVFVEDDGAGVAPADADRIFEPFYTTRPVGEGTGQGLSTAHSVIRKHGGTITVDSAPGRGSCFRIHLPVAAGQPASGGDQDAQLLRDTRRLAG